ncbi:MAG: flippase-like domain-containing protein [Candidatus Altiarchaeota archaeon]|nr:flippase-like domain-containing protein [Candidatus Altiarchaeota archaeon]
MKKKNSLAFGVGFIILAYIIYTLEPEKIVDTFLKTKPEYFLVAGVFYLTNELIAAVALRMISPGKISLIETLISHMCGMFYSNATPGRIGYYYTSLSMAKKTKTSRRGNIGLLTLFQGMNFFIKVFLCVIAVIYFSTYVMDAESLNYLLLVSIFPLIGVVLLVVIFYTKIFNRFMARIPLARNFTEHVKDMQQAVREVKKEKLFKLSVLLILGWLSMGAQWYFLAKSINLEISYLMALMLQPLLTTVMFIPISPSGLGITEAGSALLFNVIGFTAADGVAFMLLFRLNSILVDFIGIIDMKIHGKD